MPHTSHHSDRENPTNSLRFALLNHDHPTPHCDILLQEGGRLLSWSGEPGCHCRTGRSVVQRPDHRLLYLDYEGPVSGNRGHVTRIDAGRLTWIVCMPDRVRVRLSGEQYQGILELNRAEGLQWTVVWEALSDDVGPKTDAGKFPNNPPELHPDAPLRDGPTAISPPVPIPHGGGRNELE